MSSKQQPDGDDYTDTDPETQALRIPPNQMIRQGMVPTDFQTQLISELDLGMTGKPTMGEYVIANPNDSFGSRDELLRILTAIRLAAKIVSREINKAGISTQVLGMANHTNVQGEAQTKLDLFANKLFVQCLRNRDVVCGMVSEEEEDIIEAGSHQQKKTNRYIVLMDPLDGSSNIDVNVPVGTIFSVVRRASEINHKPKIDDYLQKGRNIMAAGYVLYGSSTMLVMSTGNGVHGFTLDPSIGTLYLTHPHMRFPDSRQNACYSINEGNYNDFSPGVRAYLDLMKERKITARYVGSLVADFHRNLIKGGIYIYPPTQKAPNGKLRLLYEVAPMAFLAEQAGGAASTGTIPCLDVQPKDIHQRVPMFVGPKYMVGEAVDMLKTVGTCDS
ncbi:hypothetical protein FOZ61_005550 [Perkinsus olseni]|uniref:fructose-bisphosphatase n=1 Tax=Perkinsus olseni TaxID=32597 RepID=A0A7J6LGT8_PEROL|nr:hypothetical protein FOZ61_005550 [Perkinsus olseni]